MQRWLTKRRHERYTSCPAFGKRASQILFSMSTMSISGSNRPPYAVRVLVKKHAAVESSLYNLENDSPHSDDIEAAVQESVSDQSEIDAINNESKSRALERQVESVLQHNLTVRANGAVRTIMSALAHRRLMTSRCAVSNWRHNTTRGTVIDKINIEKERIQFRLDQERAAREGVMREEHRVLVDESAAHQERLARIDAENRDLREQLAMREQELARMQRDFVSSTENAQVQQQQIAKMHSIIAEQEERIRELESMSLNLTLPATGLAVHSDEDTVGNISPRST